MPNWLRNTLAVFAGLIIGSAVNMAIVLGGSALVPPPAGVDVSDAESISRSIHLFEPKHFVTPFLAHAVGTLVGAIVAFLIAGSHKTRIAWAIGAVFLCGGVATCFMIPAPAWFMALDVLGAYLPMAWLGIRIGGRLRAGSPASGR